MDNKGYVMSSVTFLLILPSILLVMVFADMINIGGVGEQYALTSDVVYGGAEDVEANLPVLGFEVIRKKSEEVAITGNPLLNSRETIKKEIQDRIDHICLKYNKSGVEVDCTVISVDNSDDPSQVELKSRIKVSKGNLVHKKIITQNISLINTEFPILDPLPFIKCKEFGGVKIDGDKINYGHSLSNYLKARRVKNYEVYENASSPRFIKKCPYDPYALHGNRASGDNITLINLKNCVENGFYHESADGSCIFCRLEGKGSCSHYGLESFIIPGSIPSSQAYNSSFEAPCSIDHVIFDEKIGGTYPGKVVILYSDGKCDFQIFLDNSHRQKYGLPSYW